MIRYKLSLDGPCLAFRVFILLTIGAFIQGCMNDLGHHRNKAINQQVSDTEQYLLDGDALFNKGQYDKAIAPYSKALEMVKTNRYLLSETNWRILVDNLGVSYANTGRLQNAKETFEYGISRNPTYPLFYYYIACFHAEMNDMDNTLAYLKQAFAYKWNVIAGEKMPDPRGNPCFRRFLSNEQFLGSLNELK